MKGRIVVYLAAMFIPVPLWLAIGDGAITLTVCVALQLLVLTALADALTPLGLLNFLVLQWFGVRLARWKDGPYRVTSTGPLPSGMSGDVDYYASGWRWQRWIWPLTGWWTQRAAGREWEVVERPAPPRAEIARRS